MTRRNANLVTADFQAAYGQVTLLSVENNSGAASNQNNQSNRDHGVLLVQGSENSCGRNLDNSSWVY
jgi:hypothetical protein